MSEVETEIAPPPTDHDDDGEDLSSGRLAVMWLDVDDSTREAAVQLFGPNACDPATFADAVLRTALAVAMLRGPEF